jgi:hypothetical protein
MICFLLGLLHKKVIKKKTIFSIKNQNYVRHYIREIDVNALDLHSTGHEQTPLVTHIDINNSDLITNDNRKLVIHLVDETNIMDHSKFYEIASHWPKLGIDDTSKEETDVIFAEVELSQLRYFMQPESEVTGESNPQIIIVDNLVSIIAITIQSVSFY